MSQSAPRSKWTYILFAACAVGGLAIIGALNQKPPLSDVVTGSAEEVFDEFMVRCVEPINAGDMPISAGLVPQDIITVPGALRLLGSDHPLPSGAYFRLSQASNSVNVCAVWTPTAQRPDLITFLDFEFNAWVQTLLANGGVQLDESHAGIDATFIDLGATETRAPVRIGRSAADGSRGFMIMGEFELPAGVLE